MHRCIDGWVSTPITLSLIVWEDEPKSQFSNHGQLFWYTCKMKCNKACECMGMCENIPCRTIPCPQNDGRWKLATQAGKPRVIIISVPSATLKVAIMLAIMVMVSKYQQLSTCISNQCNLWSYPRRFQQGIEPWDSQEVFHLLSSITTNVASPALSIHIPSFS